MAVQHVGTLLGVPRILSVVELGGRSSLSGPITLDVKCAGARSVENPHATCDVAGAGNRLTVRLVRHSQRKRGATDRPDLRSNGASPRPYRRSPSAEYAMDTSGIGDFRERLLLHCSNRLRAASILPASPACSAIALLDPA
jgi:hypothetical protein